MNTIINAKNENMTKLLYFKGLTNSSPSLHTLLLSDVAGFPGVLAVYDITGMFWVKMTIYSPDHRPHRLFSRGLINGVGDVFQIVIDDANFHPPASPRAQVATGGTLYITLCVCEILKKILKIF